MFEWGWYQDSKMVHLFLHFLMLANHEKGEWQGITLEPGQFITGLDKLHEITGISAQSLRTCINKLKSTGEITNKSTNKFRIITITKYSDYQIKPDKLTSKSTSNLTDNQQTTNKQLTANKKNKEYKNNKEVIAAKPQDDTNKLFDFFYKTINPNLNYANKTERAASKWLVEHYGLEKTLAAAEYAVSVQNDKYAPTITTPLQLKDKMAALAKHKAGNTKESRTLKL